MRFGSVCSGIEAASVAWNPLGWKASWLAEIEPMPCSTLAHHYNDTPNFGDMTQFESWPDDEQHAIDLLCGGTPCQSFSVAGLRKGLDDDRGNLMLTFAAIAAKYRPKWLVWENVPGVLSSNGGRDFASFLGLLSGQIIEVPQEGWGNSGIITGYHNAYSLAYRVLDAQYFGVAQRRNRVFVVGCLGANRSAAAVLFERQSLSGDIAPSRSKGQGVAGTITAGAFTGGAGGRPEGATGNHFIPTIIDRAAFNQGANALYEPLIEESETMPTIVARGPHAVLQHCATIAPTLNAHFGEKQGLENQHIDGGAGLFVTYALAGNIIGRQPENGGNGNGFSEEVSYTLTKTDQHGVVAPMKINACSEIYSEYNQGFNKTEFDHASTQETDAIALLRRMREAIGAQAFAKWGLGILDSLQSPEILRSALHGVELRPAPFSRRWVVCCALGSPFSRSAGAMHSMREAAGAGCASQGWEFSEQQLDELGAYLSELSQPGAQAERLMRDLWQAAEGAGLLRNALSAIQEARRPAGREGQPVRSGAKGRRTASSEELQGVGLHGQVPREGVLQQTCATGDKRNSWAEAVDQERISPGAMAVRRLVVEECEFLQGFPRGYTNIPHRGKSAADGNRYKALGNSWAVPCARWIGERIQMVNNLTKGD
jgi:site-specific DNA-cytosine methylase